MGKYHVHRNDANTGEIVDALEAVGVTVVRLGNPLDLLCGFKGVNYLLEVKTETGKLRASQKAFFGYWRGQALVVRSVADALAAIGLETR
jgi:hypothetical protein